MTALWKGSHAKKNPVLAFGVVLKKKRFKVKYKTTCFHEPPILGEEALRNMTSGNF